MTELWKQSLVQQRKLYRSGSTKNRYQDDAKNDQEITDGLLQKAIRLHEAMPSI